ncbi:hypothetical protein PENSUB_11185 [Penicillium subrubescens]|uniref:Uncharacterized protein n=1 Tax=Penicillium subrubescens TaxID=1316194 RepID=A0A1Q5T611_9EURO|nr:hypothetical protein PENSUB_11185 [Penicillium subrubescens]
MVGDHMRILAVCNELCCFALLTLQASILHPNALNIPEALTWPELALSPTLLPAPVPGPPLLLKNE